MAMLRWVLALSCGAALSQFPAFSDQYVQRLGGQVDALTLIADEFDASAARAGLTRAEALADLTGTAFRDAHRADTQRAFDRLTRARTDLQMLRLAGPLERILLPHRLRDLDTLRATWSDFSPALPVTTAGISAAGLGTALGWLLGLIFGRVFRRRPDPLGWR